MKRNLIRLLSLAALVWLAPGCGGKGPYPVFGKIVFSDGAPATELEGYIVSLNSTTSPEGATGVVQPDGTFRVGTFKDDDGAMPGKYQVSLTPPDPPLDQPAPQPIIAAKYRDATASGLEAEVKPGGGEVTLTVERAKP